MGSIDLIRKVDNKGEEVAGGEVIKAHPLWQKLAVCLQYTEVYRKATSQRRHINIGELRSFLRIEERAVAERPESHLLAAGDSQVALGCLAKGRSGSPYLNRELQASLGNHLIELSV